MYPSSCMNAISNNRLIIDTHTDSTIITPYCALPTVKGTIQNPLPQQWHPHPSLLRDLQSPREEIGPSKKFEFIATPMLKVAFPLRSHTRASCFYTDTRLRVVVGFNSGMHHQPITYKPQCTADLWHCDLYICWLDRKHSVLWFAGKYYYSMERLELTHSCRQNGLLVKSL